MQLSKLHISRDCHLQSLVNCQLTTCGTLKGDFDPSNTKVIHFTNNPMAQAVASRDEEAAEGMAEREALRARVQLLEEGQTKDLTIMVGRKMEEGEGSEEVAKMKEELEKAELRKQRLMEAFKKTSHDFREVVYQLTGYRIDVLVYGSYIQVPNLGARW